MLLRLAASRAPARDAFGRAARAPLATSYARACLPLERRSFHRSAVARLSEPATDSSPHKSEKVERLAQEIASLTLLEAAELTETLKVRVLAAPIPN